MLSCWTAGGNGGDGGSPGATAIPAQPQQLLLKISELTLEAECQMLACWTAGGDSSPPGATAVPAQPQQPLPEVPEFGDIMHMLMTPGVDLDLAGL